MLLLTPIPAAADGLAPLTRALAEAGKTRAEAPPLRLDESLSRAARRHAEDIARDEARAGHVRLREALASEGLADAQVVPFASIGTAAATEEAALRFARAAVKGRGLTHLGLGEARRGGRRVLVVLWVRRLLELAPLSRKVTASRASLRGQLSPGARDPGAFVTLPSGEVEALAVSVRGRSVEVEVPLDEGRGRYTVEVLASTELGPEVVALWTFFSGVAPSPVVALAGAPRSPAALRRAIDRLRSGYGLAPLAPDPKLDRAASRHARSVCSSLVAAHVLPGSTPDRRAARAGWTGPVTENVAIAGSIAELHQNLLDSPSHRRNLLDPLATHLGLGLEKTERGGTEVHCVVELLGLTPDHQR